MNDEKISLFQVIRWVVVTTILMALGCYLWMLRQEKQEEQRRYYAASKAEASRRFKEWAYIAKEKQIAPGETVKLVIIPDSTGYKLLDTKCLVYTNQEFKTSSMICPEVNNIDADNI